MDLIEGLKTCAQPNHGVGVSKDGKYLAVANKDVTVYTFCGKRVTPLHTLPIEASQSLYGLCFGDIGGKTVLCMVFSNPHRVHKVHVNDFCVEDFSTVDSKQLLAISNNQDNNRIHFAEDDEEGLIFVKGAVGAGIYRSDNTLVEGSATHHFTWISYIPASGRCVVKAITGELYFLRRKWFDSTRCALLQACV